MDKRLAEVLIKFSLCLFELLFVGILCYYRVENIGWMLVILGLGILFWVLIHIALMITFIATLKLHILDLILYLAVHFFYLLAWLFQADVGDTGGTNWTIQQIYTWPALDPFLQKYGETVFWYALGGTLLCYALIVILLFITLVKTARAQKKTTPLPEPPPPAPIAEF